MRTGFITLLGRPNVGKSTLVNAIVGRKVSITSRKPQTTRQRVLGIKTTADSQMVFVDTPGLHRSSRRAINYAMNRAARASIEGVDLILLLITPRGWGDEDATGLALARASRIPTILVINKVDELKDKQRLLPLMQESSERHAFVEIVPVSARTGRGVAELEAAICKHLPEGPLGFPEEQWTDRSERFMAAELIREQIFRALGQELPYVSAVEIEHFERTPKVLRLGAVVWVERAGQKAIVIGKGGEQLKEIGRRARLEMESLFEGKVFLDLWVKVREDWTDNAIALRSLGILEED